MHKKRYNFACFQIDNGHSAESTQTFEKAIKAIPDCLLLHFAFADILEEQKKQEVKHFIFSKVFKKLSF